MIFKVKAFNNFKYVNKGIRSEDIESIQEDIEDDTKSIIIFYMDTEPINIDEPFDSLYQRWLDISGDEEYNSDGGLTL